MYLLLIKMRINQQLKYRYQYLKYQIALPDILFAMIRQGIILPKSFYHTAEVSQVRFSVLTAEQILQWSVLEITESRLYDGSTAVKGGVNDPRLGIIKSDQTCETCQLTDQCQGHFGHIKLAEPIFHIGFLGFVQKILRCICHNCSRIKYFATNEQRDRFEEILKSGSPYKRLNELVGLLGPINRCPLADDNGDKLGCGRSIPTKIFLKQKMNLFVIEKREKHEDKQVEYTPLRVKTIFQKISEEDRKALGFITTKPTDILITVLAVAPPQIRPSVQLGLQKRAEDDITNAYSRIVAFNNQIVHGMDSFRRQENVRQMQKLAASIMVKVDTRYIPALKENHFKRRTAKKIKSIEQRLVSKEGRFRQHLMGKRVDFSARTVISPDPFIGLDQLGVPERIAQNITIPQEINQYNIDKIIDYCKRGKVKFLIQPQLDGRDSNYIYLNKFDYFQEIKKFLTAGTIAERELQEGDYVLFNRQPTLHRASMMAHKIKILPYNTFRLNLSVCSPYNADFDGDQMNMHVPQSIESIAELKHIALVPKQIINPKNGLPVMGIVQDCLLGVYLLSQRGTFLTREEVMNLMMWIQPVKKIQLGNLPVPCIIRPQHLWSGKQIISMIIPQEFSLKLISNQGGMRNVDDTSGLWIRRGQLISGIIQREHIGPGCGSLIQALWLELGPKATGQFITNIQRIVNNWLMKNSFSVGARDIVIDSCLENIRETELNKIIEDYYKNMHIFRNLPKYHHENLHQKGKKVADSLEFKINLDLNNALSRMQKYVTTHISTQKNNIYKMITARSKGSETNLVQIMFCLGNQNVDGKRCPRAFQRRALPHFPKDDNSPQPRGFVFSSFFKGLRPHQFFFHSMAGREGLSDTAVKTSNIGYLQRKLVKALQDLTIQYDGTVRDSKDNLLQRCYGQDGFHSEYIERHKLNECKLSQKQFQNIYRWPSSVMNQIGLNAEQKQILQAEYQFLKVARLKFRQKLLSQCEQQDVVYHCPINLKRIINKFKEQNREGSIVKSYKVVQMVDNLAKQCILPQYKKLFTQSVQKLNALKDHGQIDHKQFIKQKQKLGQQYATDFFHIHLKFWLCSTKVCLEYQFSQEQLTEICAIVAKKFKLVLVPAGQAIGSLAAQSLGQPTTQMTLNTFHLAGVADKNVTLGIPRLRELLDVTKEIKTPFMTVYYFKKLYWQDRESQEIQSIQRNLVNLLPERHIRDYISNTKIYFDPYHTISTLNRDILQQVQNSELTPWLLILKFQLQKITSLDLWNSIVHLLKKNHGRECHILEFVGIGQGREPQIHMRITSEATKKIGNHKTFNYLTQKQIDLKDTFLSGKIGIKSVKAAKKTAYNCKSSDSINFSLDQRCDQCVFEAIGSNMKDVLSLNYIDPSRTISNDLYEVEKILGIQAARQCFMNQLKQVLRPYSIYINHRHLTVLADWMTSRGYLTPVNRYGINRVKDVSILRRASFEETVDMLYNAAIFQESDQLTGVTEKIIFGQKVNLGTNCCQVYVDLNRVNDYKYQPHSFLQARQAEAQNQQQEETVEEEIPFKTPFGMQTPKPAYLSPSHPHISSQYPKNLNLTPAYEQKPPRPYHLTMLQFEQQNSIPPQFSNSPSYGQEKAVIVKNSAGKERQIVQHTSSPTYSYNHIGKSTQQGHSSGNKSSNSPSYDRSPSPQLGRSPQYIKQQVMESNRAKRPYEAAKIQAAKNQPVKPNIQQDISDWSQDEQ